jgi:hypothetical protein
MHNDDLSESRMNRVVAADEQQGVLSSLNGESLGNWFVTMSLSAEFLNTTMQNMRLFIFCLVSRNVSFFILF